MKRTTLALTFILVVILFIGAIAGTISYYANVINSGNSKIASLNTQIANLTNETNLNNEISSLNNEIKNLTSQISSLKGQITNLTTANLVTALGVVEISKNNQEMPINQPYNHFYISGSVKNTGKGTAYNAGLNVVAYTANGTLEINMTVPLSNGGVFGTDNATNRYVTSTFGNSSLQLGPLYGGQTATIDLDIFHEGTVTNWTVTTVWTNSPRAQITIITKASSSTNPTASPKQAQLSLAQGVIYGVAAAIAIEITAAFVLEFKQARKTKTEILLER